MRNSPSSPWVLFCMLAAVIVAAPSSTGAQTPSSPGDLSGTYLLYREGDLGGKAVASMRITAMQAGRFSIGNAVPTGKPHLEMMQDARRTV